MEPGIGRADGASYEESGNRFDLDNSSIQHCETGKIGAEAVDVAGGGDGSRNGVDSSCAGGEKPKLGNESAVGVVAGNRNVKKKIVKKTVIVKRVIMKRVPKRVLINRTEEGSNLSEVRSNVAGLASDVIENSNVVDGSKSLNPVNCVDTDDIKGNEAVGEAERNNLTMSSCDLETDKAKFSLGTISERKDTMTENELRACIVENQSTGIKTTDMELPTGQSERPIGEECGILDAKENGRRNIEAESCSGEVESDEDLEAAERRKKRKTEIFLGGLSKATKEEDIREVFEAVGSVVEVRIVVNPTSGKNRGFAFVQFATAADAKKALAKYAEVEICGKLCNTAPVQGSDTIFIGNIDRNWKSGDLVELLEKAGVEKIDTVTIKAHPTNKERNRGFAYVELQTSKYAQIAFKKLQEKDAFGKNQNVNVSWAQPINDPPEEKNSQVKMTASLAKTIPKWKQMSQTSNLTSVQHLEAKENASRTSKKPHTLRNKGKAASSGYDHVKVVNRTSTTEELVQLLRQQASTQNNPPHSGSGAVMSDHCFLLPGSKRPFSQMGHDPLSVEHQGLSQVHAESLYRISGPSSLSHGVGLLRSPYHHQSGPGFPSESINGRGYPRYFQARDRASYYEHTNPYRRC
ncbi:heterogeneous nuclear ribonucleoprotein Q-like isoform X1 [Salvia splendens]|uniref:heterogeneous nuclear ribonucleoprotein Q-like isoform X1 n=2 Tax=Salvia splendens TaxID=180675 RepID=UPI001C265BE9|nr:heterogeneous nuclear ribonucleoprotein Q-like isoform X1 [Salvia splendens]